MNRQAREILKNALAEHRAVVLADRLSCLGVLMDFGGTNNPEIRLLADAIEDNIPDRLIRSEPVDATIIEQLAEHLAEDRAWDLGTALSVVAAWSEALGLFVYTGTYSKLRAPAPIPLQVQPAPLQQRQAPAPAPALPAKHSIAPEPLYFYLGESGQSSGPVKKAGLLQLSRSGKLHSKTLIWSDGMSSWEPAGKYFPQIPPPLLTSSPPPLQSTVVAQPQTAPKKPKICGIRRRAFAISVALVWGAGMIFLPLLSQRSSDQTVLTVVAGCLLLIVLGIFSERLKNAGVTRWWVLALFIPGLKGFPWGALLMFFFCLSYPEKAAAKKGLDGPGGLIAVVGALVVAWVLSLMNH
jgi:hypothetical protein